MCRNPNNRVSCFDIFRNYGISPNVNIVTNFYRPKDFGAGAYIDMITDYHGTGYRYLLEYKAIGSNAGFWMNNDTVGMGN